MPSFISNFKQRLRLPRMFFRKPTREEQAHGGPPLEFERPIPPAPWRGIAVVITIVVTAATVAWELYVRSLGYGPTQVFHSIRKTVATLFEDAGVPVGVAADILGHEKVGDMTYGLYSGGASIETKRKAMEKALRYT